MGRRAGELEHRGSGSVAFHGWASVHASFCLRKVAASTVL